MLTTLAGIALLLSQPLGVIAPSPAAPAVSSPSAATSTPDVASPAAAPPATAPPAAAPAAAPAAPSAEEEAMKHLRLEQFLVDGDDAFVIQTFRRFPGAVLPFIDDYFEGGLGMIEKAAKDPAATDTSRANAATDAMSSFRTGLQFAELANQAFGEVIFTEYAAAFGSWSPLEQRRFREGQAAYKAGRTASKSSQEAALVEFRKGLALAEPLGDHWGVAMCQLAIADACKALGRPQEGHDAAVKAIELFGRLQLKPSYVRALTTCAALRQALKLPDMGSGQLRMALQALPADAPPAERQAILDELVTVLERVGRSEEAAKIKATGGR